MAIYTWRCLGCNQIEETSQSIGEYSDEKTKRTPWHCCKPMERMLTVNGGQSALANALAGDRHYDGLVAPDGVTLINSRSKHREYMKRNGLTIAEDYKGEWAKAAKERAEFHQGTARDPKRRAILEREFTKGEQK